MHCHFLRKPLHPMTKTSATFFSFLFSFLFSQFTVGQEAGEDNAPFHPRGVGQEADSDTKIDVPARRSASAFGIDVSHYQGTIDWEKVKLSGQHPVEFMFAKASQGVTILDEQYLRNMDEARRVGILVGSYHYFSSGGSGTEQCDFFMSAIGDVPQDLLPVVDVEECPRSWGPRSLRRNLRDFLLRMEQKYGMRPIIYTNVFFYNMYLADGFKDYILFIARYSDEEPVLVDGAEWTVWQFSERGRVGGIRHNVDLDCINGKYTLEDLMIYPAKHRFRSGNPFNPHIAPNPLPYDAGLEP